MTPQARSIMRNTRPGLAVANTALSLCAAVTLFTLNAQAQSEPLTRSIPFGKSAVVEYAVPSSLTNAHAYLEPGGVPTSVSYDLPGTVRDMTWLSDQLLIATDAGVFHLRSDADGQRLLDTAPLVTIAARAVRSTEDRLYVLTPDNQLVAFQSGEDGHWQEFSRFVAPAPVIDLLVLNNVAFLLLESDALLAVAMPTNGKADMISQLLVNSHAHRMAQENNLIFIANDHSGVTVVDAHQPSRLSVAASYRTTGPALDIAARNEKVYVACGDKGALILDVQSPTKLGWLGSYAELGDVRRIWVNDEHIATLNQNGDLALIDPSIPSQPVNDGMTRVTSGLASITTLQDHQLVTAEANTVRIWGLAINSPRVSNENLNAGEGVNFGGQRRAIIKDDALLVADWFSGLHIYDISTPTQPKVLATLHTPGSPKGIALKNEFAYLADDDHGIQIIDISDLKTPTLVGHVDTPGLAYTPIVRGNRLYLASHRGGVQILDISNPRTPTLLGQIDTPDKAWSIDVQGNIAYIAASEAGLLVYDVADPAKPKLLSAFAPGGNAEDVIADGPNAYVAFFDAGLFVLDVRDPTAPVPIAELPTPGNARGLEKQNDTLWLADWFAGVHAIDIHDPARPQLIASIDTPGAAWGIRVKVNTAYVLDWWGGLLTLDVHERSRPVTNGQYNQTTPIAALASRGRYLLAAQHQYGLQIFDAKNPLNPTWVTGMDAIGNAVDITNIEQLAYVLSADGGVRQFDVSNPFTPVLLGKVTPSFAPQRIFSWDPFLVAVDNDHLALLTTDGGSGLRIVNEWPFGVQQAIDDKHVLWLVTTDHRLWRWNQPTIDSTSPELVPVDMPVFAAHIADKRLYLFGENGELHVYVNGSTPTLEANLSVGHLPRNITQLESMLFLLNENNGVTALDIADPAAPRLRAHYPLRGFYERLHSQNGVLYGSGNTHLLALKPLPDVEVDVSQQGMVRITTPEKLPEGTYNVRITAPGQVELVWRDGLTVQPLRFH